MNIKEVPTATLKLNDDNPRYIRDEKFEKLKRSIQSFPQMLDLRPIVVDKDMVVLGGNMRLRACKDLGLDVVPILVADDLTEAQKREFIIKDNVGFGEWDWDSLANEWDSEMINEWGLDVPTFDLEEETEIEVDEIYTKKIKAPTYEITGEKPKIEDLYNTTRTRELEAEIKSANIPKEIKEFLLMASQRHTVIDFEAVAEFYAHSDKNVQELFEKNALVIIDFDKAIENGYVQLSEEIYSQYQVDADIEDE